MKAFMKLCLAAIASITFSSCHETIHIHPTEEQSEANENVRLTLRIDNHAPRLGAVVDYSIEPPVISYADDLPEGAIKRISAHYDENRNGNSSANRTEAASRASALAEIFDRLAPYNLNGDKWELYLKYQIYPCSADKVGDKNILPIYSRSVSYRADALQPEHDVEIDIPFGDITVVAVAYLVPAGTDGDWFFDTSVLYSIACDMNRRQGLRNDNIYRDCFVAGQEFHIIPSDVDGNLQHLTVTLTRPQGRYVVIADDYTQYLAIGGRELENTIARIHYPTYVNTAYSVTAHVPTSSDFNFGYETYPALINAGELPYVRLGDDWSFVNEPRSNINVNISVTGRDTPDIISNNPSVTVPLFSDRVTLVVGHWLTVKSEGGGGVFIDPDFTDEIIIRF